MNIHVFFAGAIGASIPHLLQARPTHKYKLVTIGFPLLAGYLAVYVFACETPLHGLALGLVIDHLLIVTRRVGISQISEYVGRLLKPLRHYSTNAVQSTSLRHDDHE